MKKLFASLILLTLLLSGCKSETADNITESVPLTDPYPDLPFVQTAYEPDSTSYIEITRGDISYKYVRSTYVYGKPATPFDDLDLFSLESTDEKVIAVYWSTTPTDAFMPINKVYGTVYKLPDEIQNDPYINALAVKLDGMDTVKLFLSRKQIKDGDTLRFKAQVDSKFYGYCYDDPENITEAHIYYNKSNSDDDRVVITDKKQILELYNKVMSFKHDSSLEKEQKATNMFIKFVTVYGNDLTLSYDMNKNIVNRTYPASADFAEYITIILNTP